MGRPSRWSPIWGVIAGIIFLAIELDQNNDLLSSQARSNVLGARQAYQHSISTNEGGIAALIFKARTLEVSELERFRLNVTWSMMLDNYSAMHREFEEGLLSRSDLPPRDWNGAFGANPSLRSYWSNTKSNFDQRFVDFFDKNVAANDQ